MGSKANPTIIGAFVVGAVVLTVAGLLLFSGGKFFTEKAQFVMFYDTSVNGLNVGAPVKFRGVQVGEVTEIVALTDPKEFSVVIEVVIEIIPGKFTDMTTRTALRSARDRRAQINTLIQRGMRAALQLQSMVTGLLFIELNFHPDTPVKLLGLNNQYLELPTVPSAMDQLMANVRQAVTDLGKLPLDQVLGEVIAILQRVNHILSAPEMDNALANLGNILQETRDTLHNAYQRVPTLLKRFASVENEAVAALQAARTLLNDAQTLVRNVNTQVAPLANSVKDTLVTARGALAQGQTTLKNLEVAVRPALGQAEKALASAAGVMGSESVVLNDLSNALREIEQAARSIRVLADALERNPESLIRGKSR